MNKHVAYSNIFTKLFLRSVFDDQWVLPGQPPRTIERILKWYEKRMNIRLDQISVDRPIFLISLPRSGSSMLQDILCSHSNVAYITNMMYFFPDCPCAADLLRRRLGVNIRGERFLQDSVEVDGGSPADPVGTWAAWMKQNPHSVEYKACTIEDFSLGEIEQIRTEIRKIIWCFEGRATRFECKTPALLPHILLLKDLFPDARFIHLVRDARMNANSMLKLYRLCQEQFVRIRSRHGLPTDNQTPFIPYPRLPKLAEYLGEYGAEDIRTTAHLWDDSMRFISTARPQIPHFYEVRYEDILANPKEEIHRLLNFCELPFPTESDTVFWRKLSGVGTIHHSNVYSKYDVVEKICSDMMKKYRYL